MFDFYFDIDIAYNTDFCQLLETLDKHSVRMLTLQPVGPAGGNPYVRFYGQNRQLREFADACQMGSVEIIEA
jgi:hypothetical protein